MKTYKDKPLSPYAKYKKRPYRYSDTLLEWEAEVKRAGSPHTKRARALAEEHARKFGYSQHEVTEIPPEEPGRL